jgi:hypothetical protein
VSLGFAYEMDSRAEEELMEGEKCRQYSIRQLVRSSDETLGDGVSVLQLSIIFTSRARI